VSACAEVAGPNAIRPHVITKMIRTNLRFLTALIPRLKMVNSTE
jgi:hypothetical protein